jgi:AraC-like DNA-binding protein
MTARKDVLALSVPDLHAIRVASAELYVGMKEHYAVARVESGQVEWWSRGKVWQSLPGSLQLQQPGDVHRDLARAAPTTLQIISFPAHAVERVAGPIRVHPQLAAADRRGAPFQRLHDAVQHRVDALALEVVMYEAIAAFAAVGDAACDQTRPVRRALELLRERLSEPITLDELAAHAELDKPPYAYLTRLRIVRAKQLLDRGVPPIEVAPLVGLYDQSQLNRHFRRLVGTTPGRYGKPRRRPLLSGTNS